MRKDKKDDFIVVKADEEAGFSSKSSGSNSQCLDVEVENSDELHRIMIRKSQFLPPEPYQPSQEEIDAETAPKDATLAKTLPKNTTLGRKEPLEPILHQKPVSPVQPPISQRGYSPTSPDDFADSISQVSRKSKKSLFGFGKKKKQKKDPDSQSVFSFASFKSGKSVESKSEALERKERKRREKEEKKDKKEVEKQELRLSHGLNQQKFENIYPWMNELEPFDDEKEIPNVIEEIRIREAQELNKLEQDDIDVYDERSYAAESFLDLGTQLMPVSQISEPLAPVFVNKFGAPKDGIRKPFEPTISPLVRETEKAQVLRFRQASSDAETEGVVRKARKSLADVEPSVSIEAPVSADPVPPLKKKDMFENMPLKKRDIFANVLPPSASPETPGPAEYNERVGGIPSKNIETQSDPGDTEDRDLKKEIEEVTQLDDYLQTISVDINEHRSKREKKKRARAEKSEKSKKKKKRSPTRIESNPIEDRSIDDIPVEKDLLADLTNPLLFPEPPQEKKKEIPIVNYTRSLNEDIKKKDDGDKVESIKEIQNTLDRRKKELSEKESDKEVKITNKDLRNETTRVVVDENLVQNRMSYFDLDDGVLDHMNFRGVESERDLLIKNGAPSGSRIPGQQLAPENSGSKRRRKKDRSERSERRRHKDESEAEREERRKRRREGDRERRESEDSENPRPRRRPKASSDNEDAPARRRRARRDESSGVKSEADAPKEKRRRERRRSRPDSESREDRHSRRDSRKDRDSRGNGDNKNERRRDRSRDDSNTDRKKERSSKDHRRSTKAKANLEVKEKAASRESATFSDDKPPTPARKEVKEIGPPRKGSPVEVYEKDGALKAFPSHIARDIKSDMVEKRRKEFQDKKQLELIRQKMDLDFQSVDTKRSVFVSNDQFGNNQAPLSPTPVSATSSKHKSGKKGKKKSKDVNTAPKPKPRRVSSRPKLDPIRSQEEAAKARPRRVIYETDEDKSGSTLHSGDEKPKVIKRQSSVTSNDSTLKDIGDIPSEWNVSMMSRSRQVSARSNDSRDSRLTHRSQLSAAKGSRGASPVIVEEKPSKKKKKRKSLF